MLSRRLTFILLGLFVAAVIIYQQVLLGGLRADLAETSRVLRAGVGAIQNDVDELKQGVAALRAALAGGAGGQAAAPDPAGGDRAEFDKFARRAGLDAAQRDALWPEVDAALRGLRELKAKLDRGAIGRPEVETRRAALADRLAQAARRVLRPEQARLFDTVVEEIRGGAGPGR